MIILRQHNFSIPYGHSGRSKKEEDENFDKEVRISRKLDRGIDASLTGLGSASLGAIIGGSAGLSKGKGKRGAIIGSSLSTIAGLGSRDLYRKVNKSKEKEDQEDKETSNKFSQLKGKDDRFNVFLNLKHGMTHKEAVDKVIKGKSNENDSKVKK